MTGIIIKDDVPQCPLCLNKMKSFISKKRGIFEKIFTCIGINCMVSINAVDPAVGKWLTKDPMPCPVCGSQFRVFFRTIDKYFKAQCPECLAKRGRVVQVVREAVPNSPKDR